LHKQFLQLITNMKLIMESWRKYLDDHQLITESGDDVTGHNVGFPHEHVPEKPWKTRCGRDHEAFVDPPWADPVLKWLSIRDIDPWGNVKILYWVPKEECWSSQKGKIIKVKPRARGECSDGYFIDEVTCYINDGAECEPCHNPRISECKEANSKKVY